MKVDVRDQSCALIAVVPTLHRLKIARSGRRRRFNVEKIISFPEARQLVEAKMPTVISGGKTYAAAASTRRESKSVEFQTSLTWGFSERPLRTTESNVRSSGGPGSVSTGFPASSRKSRTVSADARVPCESAKCSSETDRGSADPPKRPLGVPPIPTKWHLRVQQVPEKRRPRKMIHHLRGAHLVYLLR